MCQSYHWLGNVKGGNSDLIHDQMSSIMNSKILFNSWIIILLCLNIHKCKSDICTTCLCSVKGIYNFLCI